MAAAPPSRLLSLPTCRACRAARVPQRPASIRRISASSSTQAPPPGKQTPLSKFGDKNTRAGAPSEGALEKLFGKNYKLEGGADGDEITLTPAERLMQNTHHLHVYSTKHNTHLTLTRPTHETILSLSCGNLGFKKGNRGTFEAAYQLASLTLKRIQESGTLAQMKHMEVVLRGYGVGREAVTKAILGQEGRAVRAMIVRVSDSTRIKFGGTRSPNPRRLG